MTNALKKLTLLALPFLVVGGIILASTPAFADTPILTGDPNTALTTVTDQTPQSSAADANPFEIIGKVINAALGLLGIVFFGMILYAGFLWMTSGGESEKAKEAQKLILNGIIGILIILSAAAVSNFVLDNLIEAAG